MTEGQYQARRRNQKKEKNCGDPINRLDPVDMTSFSGKNICVRRDGQRPIDSVKPTESGCPSGYKACSSQTTNWWDIVCIPNSFDAATSCPVTAVNFVPISQISSYGS